MISDFSAGIQIAALTVFETPVQTLLSTVVRDPLYFPPDRAGLKSGSRRQRALRRLIGGDQIAVTNGDHVLACYGTCKGDDTVCRSPDTPALLRCQVNPTMTAQPRMIRRIKGTNNNLRCGIISSQGFKGPQPAPAAGCSR